MEVAVWRGDASGGAFVKYAVPRLETQTVLDVVTWIQRNVASTLAYRFSCRVGMCGSCAMMVNGAPRWTCRTHVQKVLRRNCIEIAPLRNLPVIKDLAVDMAEFFDKWMEAEGRFHSRGDAPRRHRAGATGFHPTSGRRCRDRVHQLRDLLRVMRCRGKKREISRSRRPQPRVDPGKRRTRLRPSGEVACCRRRRGMSQLPLAAGLHDLLPERSQPDVVDCRAEATDRHGSNEG